MYHACANNDMTLLTLYEWCNTNRLPINFKKTKHIAVTRDIIDDVYIFQY